MSAPDPRTQTCAQCGRAGAVPTCQPCALPRLTIMFLAIGPRLCCADCRESIRLERAVARAKAEPCRS
jgi:hypothetical protein